jgi:hypothetical protein
MVQVEKVSFWMAKNNKTKQAEILSGHSKDIRGELFEILKKTASGVFSEGKVYFDRLRTGIKADEGMLTYDGFGLRIKG